jgi:hypothetical protein
MRPRRPRKPARPAKVRVKAVGGPYDGQTLVHAKGSGLHTLEFDVTLHMRTSETGFFLPVRWFGRYVEGAWIPSKV